MAGSGHDCARRTPQYMGIGTGLFWPRVPFFNDLQQIQAIFETLLLWYVWRAATDVYAAEAICCSPAHGRRASTQRL